MDIKDIQKAMKEIWSRPVAWPDPSTCTAELMDENDEEGIVVIKGPKGGPIAYMPRSVYEAIRDGNARDS